MNNLTVEELEGGYRLLCGAMLAHTARLMAEFGGDGRSTLQLGNMNPRGTKVVSYTREVARQRSVAEQWLAGGGAVAFDECCDEVGVQPREARNKLGQFVDACNRRKDRDRRFVTPSRASKIAGIHRP